MGSAASLDALPDELSEDQLKILCGESFNQQEFNYIAQGRSVISKVDFLDAIHNKTDVFLTHDWGKVQGQDNHQRVGEINRRLRNRGLTTWFDSDRLEGNVKKQMALGIDNAQCIIAFVTKRYIDKVGGFNAEDNCQLEFNYAARRKTASKMIPVVMEDCVRHTGTWDGEVGLVLGGRLYVDMCGDVWDDEYCESCIDDLYSKIIKIIKTPVKGFLTGPPTGDNSERRSAETMATQVRPPPKKKKPKNTKPLKELSVDDVSLLLENSKLSKYVQEMKSNDVDGETLFEVQNDEEMKELGISLSAKARLFFRKVEEYKFGGVPFSLIGIEEIKEEEDLDTVERVVTKNMTKHGDGKFTISGATGGCASRINGTFEIGDEMQNGLPIYTKVGDSDTFIELCHGPSGWRWYVKRTKDKGPNSSVCFGYYQCDDENMMLPSQTDNSAWFVYENKEFVTQSTVVITPSDDLPLPSNINLLLAQARSSIKEAKLELIAEKEREPYPGSFRIEGATGKLPKRINGVFEPTSASQNGFPVYRKKGEGQTWVEMVYKPESGWRWYLKPTANKGPDSSICFAYFQCDEEKILLPQECASWYINTTEGFEEQSTVVTLASSEPIPDTVTSRYEEGLVIVKERRDARRAEETRGVIAGTFRLSGATGKSEGRFNGVFEPSEESQNGFPVFRKKCDADTWIELVHGASGWRWYLKPTANKGPDSSICFAYYQCDERNIPMPWETVSPWNVHTSSGFVEQPTTVKSESPLPLPDHLVSMISEGRMKIEKGYKDLFEEENRDAAPGSFRITGATGKSMVSVNGTYEPTIESQLGFPVYKKKGSGLIWIEMVFTVACGWRWYLKPTANRGPESSICFAFAECNEDDVKLPGDMTVWKVSTNEGFVPQSSVKVEYVSGPNTQEVLDRLEEGKAVVLKKKTARMEEETRDAVQGSFRISGAVGKSALRTNGVFEPTEVMQNGMPVYAKKGDADTWIELVHGPSGWRWYLKPTANKGPDSSICFSYFTHEGDDVRVPVECASGWFTNTVDGFEQQSSIGVTAVGPPGQPPHVPTEWSPP